MEFVLGLLATLVVLVIIGWVGLKIRPRPFEPYPVQSPDLATISLPLGLPAPVERFYRAVYRERIPVITSAVISGRAQMRVSGITFFITDPRVRWEPVNDDTALPVVPCGEGDETFVVRFAPQTGLLRWVEAMRYRDAADEDKILWINGAREWRDINRDLTPVVVGATWLDEGDPWAIFTIEQLVSNADVSDYISRAGP